MDIKMRNLQTQDIFAMSKILKKINLKLDLKDGMSKEQVGSEFIMKVLENLHLAQDEVNEFLANLVGMDKGAFNKLDIEDTFKVLEMFKTQKGIINFFKLAGK